MPFSNPVTLIFLIFLQARLKELKQQKSLKAAMTNTHVNRLKRLNPIRRVGTSRFPEQEGGDFPDWGVSREKRTNWKRNKNGERQGRKKSVSKWKFAPRPRLGSRAILKLFQEISSRVLKFHPLKHHLKRAYQRTPDSIGWRTQEVATKLAWGSKFPKPSLPRGVFNEKIPQLFCSKTIREDIKK